jgi:hypothetical protein
MEDVKEPSHGNEDPGEYGEVLAVEESRPTPRKSTFAKCGFFRIPPLLLRPLRLIATLHAALLLCEALRP